MEVFTAASESAIDFIQFTAAISAIFGGVLDIYGASYTVNSIISQIGEKYGFAHITSIPMVRDEFDGYNLELLFKVGVAFYLIAHVPINSLILITTLMKQGHANNFESLDNRALSIVLFSSISYFFLLIMPTFYYLFLTKKVDVTLNYWEMWGYALMPLAANAGPVATYYLYTQELLQ